MSLLYDDRQMVSRMTGDQLVRPRGSSSVNRVSTQDIFRLQALKGRKPQTQGHSGD